MFYPQTRDFENVFTNSAFWHISPCACLVGPKTRISKDMFVCLSYLGFVSQRKAGEALLVYALQQADNALRLTLLTKCVKNLLLSIRAHRHVLSLLSKEQLYEFIMALFSTHIALESKREHEDALQIRQLCVRLYAILCQRRSVVLSSEVRTKIRQVLRMLNLPAMQEGSQTEMPAFLKNLDAFDYAYPSLRHGDPLSWLGQERDRFRLVSVPDSNLLYYGGQTATDPAALSRVLDQSMVDPTADTLEHNPLPMANHRSLSTREVGLLQRLTKSESLPESDIESKLLRRPSSKSDSGLDSLSVVVDVSFVEEIMSGRYVFQPVGAMGSVQSSTFGSAWRTVDEPVEDAGSAGCILSTNLESDTVYSE